MDTTTKKFRMSDYIKDGHLAQALRSELKELRDEQRALAEEAIVEVATTGVPGSFDQLLDAYKQGIARALNPERKLVKNPQIDRKIIRNPQLAAFLDKELQDVTSDEVAAVNAALKAIFDAAREVTVVSTEGGVRYVMHDDKNPVCRTYGNHPTVPAGEKEGCGYYRAPEEWREVLRLEVRKVLKR